MMNIFPTSAIDPFPKGGFPVGDPAEYDQYTDLFASLFTFPVPMPQAEPAVPKIAEGNVDEALFLQPDGSGTGVTRSFTVSDGMADILGLFPAGADTKKKSARSETPDVGLADVEQNQKSADIGFLGPPIPIIPVKPVGKAVVNESVGEPPENICNMPVDGKVHLPQFDVKNKLVNSVDAKVDRRKHEDDHPVEFEILELPTEPVPIAHKSEIEATQDIQPLFSAREPVQSEEQAAVAVAASSTQKPQPLEARPKIWTADIKEHADLKEHKITKRGEVSLLETFTNNIAPEKTLVSGIRNSGTAKNLWEGAETFIELNQPADEKPQRELATEFSFESSIAGDPALRKVEKSIDPDVKVKRMILDQVGSSLADLALRQKDSPADRVLKIRLKPAELGTVEITLSKDANGVIGAHFRTDNPHTQQLLSETLMQLRDSLENSGMKVGSLETSCTASFSGGDTGGGRECQTFETPSEPVLDRTQFSGTTKSDDDSKQNRLLNLQA